MPYGMSAMSRLKSTTSVAVGKEAHKALERSLKPFISQEIIQSG